MIDWKFDANDYEEQSFKPIPAGDHRVRIESAEEMISKSGKEMIKMVLEISGYNNTIWHFMVFLPDNQKLTNQKLGEIFNSFGIQPGNLNVKTWVGKVGAARVKHEDYEGEPTAKIAYFIGKDKQEKLPPWKEPSSKASLTGGGSAVEIATDDLPWM